jgi:hypothetical protein
MNRRSSPALFLAITLSLAACEQQPLDAPVRKVGQAEAADSGNARLTWPDVLKLSVPFFFSLCLLWATQKHNLRVKRKARQRLLARLHGGPFGYLEAIQAFNIVKEAVKENKVRMFSFDIPAIRTKVAERLAELDPTNAHIYVQYVSNAEVVRAGNRMYLELLKSLVSSKDELDLCKAALFRQMRALKGDLIKFARSDFDLMEVLEPAARREPGYDPEALGNLWKEILEAEKLFAEDRGT